RFRLRFRGVGGKEFALEIAEIALRLLEISALSGPGRGQGGELLDALFRQINPRSQRCFFVRGVVELILCSLQRRLGGFLCGCERHRVDLEKHLAFFDRPVWFNRNFCHLTGDAGYDGNDIVLCPHVGRRGRADVHEENQDRQTDDRDRGDDDLTGDVPRQQLELEKNQRDDDRVDDKENEFHCALAPSGLFLCFEFRDPGSDFFDFFLLVDYLLATVSVGFVDSYAVSHLVQDR